MNTNASFLNAAYLSKLEDDESNFDSDENESFSEVVGNKFRNKKRETLSQVEYTIDMHRFCTVCRLMKLPFPNSTLVEAGNEEIGDLLHIIYKTVHSWVIFCFAASMHLHSIY